MRATKHLLDPKSIGASPPVLKKPQSLTKITSINLTQAPPPATILGAHVVLAELGAGALQLGNVGRVDAVGIDRGGAGRHLR